MSIEQSISNLVDAVDRLTKQLQQTAPQAAATPAPANPGPARAPAPPQPAKTPEPGKVLDFARDVKPTALAVAGRTDGREVMKRVLAPFGIDKASLARPEQLADLLAALQKELPA